MANYETLETGELETELSKQQALLADIRDERAFMGKQIGMHINASEFARLDRDAEAAEKKIATLEELLTARSAGE